MTRWLATALFIAACARAPRETRETQTQCTGSECAAACQEGRVECRDDKVATCRDGNWIERSCPIACRAGRCVECSEWERRCVDDREAESCEQGVFVRTDCGAGGCEGGGCRCPENTYRCTERGRERCDGFGIWTVDACPSDLSACHEGSCLRCVPGSAVCLDARTSKVCSDNGRSEGPVACPSGCDSPSGRCLETCLPGSLRCRSARVVERCNEDGNRHDAYAECDVGQAGERCSQGACRSTCADAVEAMSPSGCLFHGTPMDFPAQAESIPPEHIGTDRPLTIFHIVNADRELAVYGEVSQGGGAPTAFFIPPGESFQAQARGRSVSVFNSHRVAGAVVSIRSTRPVYVVQHMDVNDIALSAPGNEESQSGDTAFLLPAHLIEGYGTRYRILTQPFCAVPSHPYHARPGGFTVVSTSPNTNTLHVAFTAPTLPGPGGEPIAYAAGASADVSLGAGEAIHFRAASGDLTGTLLDSTAPVAVFNGGVSRVPCAAGHVQTQLVEQIMPVGLWGVEGQPQMHLAAARQLAPLVGEEKWVALTDEADNDLRLEPVPGSGTLTTRLVAPGDFYSFYTASDAVGDRVGREFTLESTKPILLGRYYYVKNFQGGSTFTFERPLGFWRAQYSVRSVGASENRLLLIVPEDAEVELDSAPLSAPRRAGRPGYQIVELDVSHGVHHVSAGMPFGLLVYGFTPGGVRDCFSYSGPIGFKDAF